MNVGDVVRTASFRDNRQDGVELSWKAPKGKVFVFILLGVEDKALTESSEELDPNAVLNAMGWHLTDEVPS